MILRVSDLGVWEYSGFLEAVMYMCDLKRIGHSNMSGDAVRQKLKDLNIYRFCTWLSLKTYNKHKCNISITLEESVTIDYFPVNMWTISSAR